jgi:two-component system, OmpR family, copper resistance phosphate regulon response regulator CusR
MARSGRTRAAFGCRRTGAWYDREPLNRILIAEDEPQVAGFLERGLREAGYTTTVCADGVSAAERARDGDFDLLILDLGLPGQDGFDVLRAVRGRSVRMPVLVLTARHRVEDTVAALEAGADDYLTKPFAFDELLARVGVRFRSSELGAPAPRLAGADVDLDVARRRATVEGEQVDLTDREFLLLETLLRRPGEVLSRDELIARVWGEDADVAANIVDVYVSSLRRKLGTQRIETVRGAGYRVPAGGRS